MEDIYAFLLSLVGALAVIFNRLAAEETLRILPDWVWPQPTVLGFRIIVIVSGTFFILFGLMMMSDYLR